MAVGVRYPKISTKAWSILRSRASSAPSTRFTPSVVASLLNLSNQKSALDNVIYPLRRVGLLGEDGELTDRGRQWRVDTGYGVACQEILDEVYPEELRGITHSDGAIDRTSVQNWFEHQGFGGSNASQMAATYIMIAERQLPSPPDAGKKTKKASPDGVIKRKPSRSGPGSNASSSNQDTLADITADESVEPTTRTQSAPAVVEPKVHLDIQIHIPADASLDKIDQIFASMAKHLYQR